MTTATTEPAPLTLEEAEAEREAARETFDAVKDRPGELQRKVRELRAEAARVRQSIEDATGGGDVAFDYGAARQRAEALEAEADDLEAGVEDAERKSEAALAQLCVARGQARRAELLENLAPQAGELGDRVREAVQTLYDLVNDLNDLNDDIRVTYAAVNRDLVDRGGVDSSIMARLPASAWSAAGFHALSGPKLRRIVAEAVTDGFLNDRRAEP